MAEAKDSDRDSEDSDCEEEIECLVEPKDCTLSLAQVLQNILGEELVNSSSMGPSVISVVNTCIKQINSKEMEDFSDVLLHEIKQCCLNKGKIRLSTVWRKFHILRLSSHIRSAWKLCVPMDPAVCNLTLQIIMKRMIHGVIHEMTTTESRPSPKVQSLSQREESIIRYMAGYVVFKVMKKFPLCSGLFESFQLSFEEKNFLTIQDYTRSWTELIDRGGLCHVTDDFFKLMVAIEYVARKYLDIRITPTNDLMLKITRDVVESPHITHMWDQITSSSLPPGDKSRSDVLKAIVSLWCNIRIHSFAEKWTEQLHKGHKKGIRKTLKQKGTEKESS